MERAAVGPGDRGGRIAPHRKHILDVDDEPEPHRPESDRSATMPTNFPTELVRALRQAQSIAVLTGAGISAESGVPTFRDAQTGVWAKFKPEELATPEAFRRDPKLVWEWYAWRRDLVAGVEPNAGHRALVELERRTPQFTLITQNVDGLHQRAGSRNVIEIHGNITRTKCFEEDRRVDRWELTDEVPPRCPRCGGRLRPDVVWFNEMLPRDAMERALVASRDCEVFLSIGTSGLVQPAASLPLEALERKAVVIEINPVETPLTPRARHSLRGAAGVILPALLSA
jgi:NAD-dependent deacetylase